MKNTRFLILAMLVIFAMVVASCAGQGEAGDQGANAGAAGAANDNSVDTVGEPGAQQTDMPGTADAGEVGGADTTGSGTDATDNTDTGVTGAGTGEGTGPDASGDLSGGADSDASGAMSGNFMGRWNFGMLDGCTVAAAGAGAAGNADAGSDEANSSSGASGNANASDTQIMTCTIDGNAYVIGLRRGDAGSAGSLQEWAETDMSGQGAEDFGDMTETSVGNFDAITFRLPDAMVQDGEISGATCAARTYVWGMGNADGAGNSDNAAGNSGNNNAGGNSGDAGNSENSNAGGNSAANDNNAKNLLIVTVYQTSGDECNAEQVMTDFLAGFQGGDGDMGDAGTTP